jgi:hypothetical protein
VFSDTLANSQKTVYECESIMLQDSEEFDPEETHGTNPASIPDIETYDTIRMMTGCLGITDTYQVFDFRQVEVALGIGPE